MPPSPHLSAHRGFSLVELLVVLVIMAGLLALALSGLFSGKDANRLLAAEHLLADLVRQARHTARSTGAPVELRLTPVVDGSQVVGARIAGISRTPIFHESFDPRDPGTGLPVNTVGRPGAAYDDLGQTLGRSGIGRMVGPGVAVDPAAPPPYPSAAAFDDAHPSSLHGQRALVRGTTQDGFYLSCAVRLPLANTLPEPNPIPTAPPQTWVPLVMVGDMSSAAMGTSQCGLALWLSSRRVATPGGSYTVRSWDLRGWVRGEGTGPVEVSSLDDPPADLALDRQALENGELDVANPIAGGEWEEFGLLYDGERLVLYRNGRRVGVLATGVPTVLARLDDARVWIGQLANPLAPSTDLHAGWHITGGAAQGAVLDDVRLDRLGTDQLGELPRGIVLIPALNQQPTATLAYRIVAHPDGRVEVLADGNPTPLNAARTVAATGTTPQLTGFLTTAATIFVSQRLALDGAHSAKLSVGIDGRVGSTLFPAP